MNTAILSKANDIIRKNDENGKAIEAENRYQQTCINAGICPICGKELIREERKTSYSFCIFLRYTVKSNFLVCKSNEHHFEHHLFEYGDMNDDYDGF